jgi:hypothetical protein
MENADRNLIVDQTQTGTHATAVWGVVTGLEVSQNSGGADLNVEVADGVAYDEQGRRIPHSGGPTLVDLATAVPGSDSRYVRVYAEFTRVLSDPRTDGLGGSIDYRQAEGVTFSFDLGTPAASPTRPALLANKVCLATVLIASGATQIFDADISDELPSLGGLSDPDRQEGGVIAHGRLNPARRKLHFAISPLPGGEEVLNLGTGNHMNVQGGQLRMATVGSDGGDAAYMEYASIYKAGEVRVAGNIQDGGGYWYSNQTSDEFGEPLLAISKYLQFDASAFYCADNGVSPQDPTLASNRWYIQDFGTRPLTQVGWNVRVNGPAGYFLPLYLPLVGLPFRAQLEEFEVDVECSAVVADLEYGVALYRRSALTTDAVMISGGGSLTTAALGSTGAHTIQAGAFTPHLIRPDLYAYFAAVWVRATAVTPGTVDAGIYVTRAQLKYTIREASGEYYHPTL